jgi:hypothetical protein
LKWRKKPLKSALVLKTAMSQPQPQLTLDQWIIILCSHSSSEYELPYSMYLLARSVVQEPVYSGLGNTTTVIHNAVLTRATEDPVFSSPATFNTIAGFITPQSLVGLQTNLRRPENARWIWAEPRFVDHGNVADARTGLEEHAGLRQQETGDASASDGQVEDLGGHQLPKSILPFYRHLKRRTPSHSVPKPKNLAAQ